MPATKEELQERAQLIRTHEANCSIEHPTADELSFRWATMKRIARAFNYPELKNATLAPTPTRAGSNVPSKKT